MFSDIEKNEVRRYTVGDKNGTIVAGGNGKGNQLNQLNFPTYLFVDEEQAVYVSDFDNHRVMKWNKGAKEGIVVAGGQGYGSALTQLFHPQGLSVDISRTIYVTDSSNHSVECSYVSPMKHHETNGFSVLDNVCSCRGMVVRFFLSEPWLSLFSGGLSRRVIASLY